MDLDPKGLFQKLAPLNVRADCCRKEELVEASKDWITPETLEQRISMALNNPTKLYEEPTAS